MRITKNKNKGIKRHLMMATAAGLALALAGCGNTASNNGKALKSVSMMTDVAFLPKHAPFFSAVEQGFFREEGIDLKILPGSGSNNTVVAVDTGKVDFGWADFGVTVLNQGKGVHVKQIALVQASDAYAAVTVARSGIKSWADLKGKTVATEGAGAMTAMWPLALKKLGFKDTDVKLVPAAGEAKIPGLLAGQWDANLSLFVSDAPVLVGLGQEPTVLKWADLGIHLYGSGILANDQKLEKDPELAKSFTRAITKGFLWACDHKDQAAKDMMKSVTGFKEEALKNALEGQCSLNWSAENETQGYGTMSDAGVSNSIQIAKSYLGLNNDALTPADVYTNKFVEPIKKGTKIVSPSE